MLSMGHKSSKFVGAAIFLVILFNVYIFGIRVGTPNEFQETLKSTDVIKLDGSGSNPLSSLMDKDPGQTRLVTYFDARTKGIMVVGKEQCNPETLTEEEMKQSEELRVLSEMSEDNRKFAMFQIDLPKIAEPAGVRLQNLESLSAHGKFVRAFSDFMGKFVELIDKHKPTVDKINTDDHYKKAKEENRYENKDGRMPTYGGHWREAYLDEDVRTKEYLSYFLRLSENEVKGLKSKHKSFLENMPEDFPKELYDYGASFDFMKGNGIVYLGGGRYNQLVLLSLSVLRAKGSTLPVEVIMPYRKDFDIDLCNNVLPSLNAGCRILEDMLPKSVLDRTKGYQLKNMALLSSSFENVLYLDADNIPVKNPDYLFYNEPFKSSRMIMWPDLWRRSTSPHFYDVAEFPLQPEKLVRNSFEENDPRGRYSDHSHYSFHDTEGTIPEASSETGQIMIDKKTHLKTLFLAMYYNFHGPDYYYAMLSQGAAGEGDKETFIAAAHRLKLPYYQVNEFNREFGPLAKYGKREVFGMGQYDPIVDHLESKGENRRSAPAQNYAKNAQDSGVSNYYHHYYKTSSLMFLHANWPKFYVDEMFEQNSHGRGIKDKEGKSRRLYTKSILDETGGVDIELEIFEHLKMWYCSSKINLQGVTDHGSDRRNKICTGVDTQLTFLQKN